MITVLDRDAGEKDVVAEMREEKAAMVQQCQEVGTKQEIDCLLAADSPDAMSKCGPAQTPAPTKH